MGDLQPMRTRHGRPDRSYRTVFVSDIHLGCRHSQADQLVDFLEANRPEKLYVVGDFIDGWRLKRRWWWCSEEYGRLLQLFVDLAENGTELYYTPGNHDEFLRHEQYLHRFLEYFDFVTVRDEFVHETADGRRFAVLHGDRFDRFETGAQWVSKIAAAGYDWLLMANRLCSRALSRPRHRTYEFSASVKKTVKTFVRFLSDFETRVLEHADTRGCDGAICGHVHTPTIARHGDLTYCNSGDWVEHCSALVEHDDGELEVVFWRGDEGVADSIRDVRAVRETDVAEPVSSFGPALPEPERLAESLVLNAVER